MIYIAGPLTAATEEQMRRYRDMAVAAYLELVTRRIPAHCPHLSAYIPGAFAIPYDDWIYQCLTVVRRSSAIWMLPGWTGSKGARLEWDLAVYIHLEEYRSCTQLLTARGYAPTNTFDGIYPPHD